MRPLTTLIITGLLTACHAGPVGLAAANAPSGATARTSAARKTDTVRYKQQSLSVSNVDKSAAFYARHFGYTVASKQTFPELTLVVLERPDHRLQLMSGGTVAKLDWRQSQGFFVTDFDKKAAEMPILRPPFQVAPGGPRIFFAKDPDGYPVEVIEDMPAK